MNLAALKKAFAKIAPQTIAIEGYQSCAVLAPLFEKNGEVFLLYTQRSDQVRHHKGQISFPGGMKDKRDRDLIHTALREAHEEIGVPERQIEILGRLPQIFTPTGYAITPFPAWLTQGEFLLNPDEVHQLIEVPLIHLLSPQNYHREVNEFFPRFAMASFQYQQHRIWGATGKITEDLVSRLQARGRRK